MRRARALAGALLVLATAAHAGTKWVTTWTGPHADRARPLKKILVIGMSSDTTIRRMFEEDLAARIAGGTTQATPSFAILPRLTLDAEPLRARVREYGFDGVLITRLIGRGSKSRPPSAEDASNGAPYGPYATGYAGWQGEVYSPGYLSSETIVRLQSRLWSVEDGGQALWTGVSDGVGLENLPRACRQVSSLVVRELRKHGLI